MGLLDNARNWLLSPLMDKMSGRTQDDIARNKVITTYRAYSEGVQRQQLPVKKNKPNDNIVLNLTGKAIEKSVALLFGVAPEFDLEQGEEDKDQIYINDTWEKNQKDILLNNQGKAGSEDGTHFIKILKDFWNEGEHRLLQLDALQMDIDTNPQDVDEVWRYTQTWSFSRFDELQRKSIEVFRREISEREFDDEGKVIKEHWIIRLEEKSRNTSNQWEQVGEPQLWEYEFPPIIHGQNLSRPHSPWGESDISPDLLVLQDKTNYIASNVSKIIRYHAHPKTIGVGFTKKNVEGLQLGADVMTMINTSDPKVFNLEMQSDLESSRKYLDMLVQSFFALTSTVEPSVISDKLGQLTNFGLKILYQDALEKLSVKRALYGAFLQELNRRLLVINGSEDATGGKVVWSSEVIPQSADEESQVLERDMRGGLVSKETSSGLRGYDWEVEQERISEEVAEGDIGAQIVRALTEVS